MSHLWVFGAKCWAKILTVHGVQVTGGSKLDSRGVECRFLGYLRPSCSGLSVVCCFIEIVVAIPYSVVSGCRAFCQVWPFFIGNCYQTGQLCPSSLESLLELYLHQESFRGEVGLELSDKL